MNLVTIVPAAGLSRRMGGTNKLAALIEGRPVLRRTVDALLAAGLGRIRVVVGHEAAAVRDLLVGCAVEFIPNPDFARGVGTSVAAGVRALSGRVDGIVICLGDLPWLDPADVRRVVRRFEAEDRRCVVRPVHGAVGGHPVVIPVGLQPRLAGLRADVGAREVIRSGKVRVVDVAAGPGVVRDVDDPGDVSPPHR